MNIVIKWKSTGVYIGGLFEAGGASEFINIPIKSVFIFNKQEYWLIEKKWDMDNKEVVFIVLENSN